MREQVSAVATSGAMGADVWTPIFVHFLLTVFHPNYSISAIGEQSARELRTLAESMDQVLLGNVMTSLDIQVQRFKSVLMASTDLENQAAAFRTSKLMELIPTDLIGATSQAELELLRAVDVKDLKTRDLRRKLSEAGGSG